MRPLGNRVRSDAALPGHGLITEIRHIGTLRTSWALRLHLLREHGTEVVQRESDESQATPYGGRNRRRGASGRLRSVPYTDFSHDRAQLGDFER